MAAWVLLLIPSAIIGALCAFFINHKSSVIFAGAIPWFGLLAALIYTVYFAPNADGGDGFWIIAQFFGGTLTAGAGVSAFLLTKEIFRKNPK